MDHFKPPFPFDTLDQPIADRMDQSLTGANSGHTSSRARKTFIAASSARSDCLFGSPRQSSPHLERALESEHSPAFFGINQIEVTLGVNMSDDPNAFGAS